MMPACRCAVLPDHIYACDPSGACDPGFTCIAGFCEPAVDGGTDAGCSRLTCTAEQCGSVGDGCGGMLDCGACQPPFSCGLHQPNRCGCDPITSASQACPRSDDGGISSGSITLDNCGTFQTFTCGPACASGTCSDNFCCAAETEAALCASAGYHCGSATAVDHCGVHRSLSCGFCPATTTCVSSDIGSTCVPANCLPETDAEFCDRHGANCGTLTANDSCGQKRTDVLCGGACDAGGCDASVPNECQCQPVLHGCIEEDQCCSGHSCNMQGLCCTVLRGICQDDGECCSGSCATGACCVGPGISCVGDLDCCSGSCNSDGGCAPYATSDGGGPL
jgi:hypothetical protein